MRFQRTAGLRPALLVLALCIAGAPAALARDVRARPPTELRDLDAWIDYKVQAGLPALPEEARLFHRGGVQALRAGDAREAARLFRGAAELDPHYLAPHASLFGLYVLGQPGQAVHQAAVMLDLVRDRFGLQVSLVGAALFYVLHGLFLGLLLASLGLVCLHFGEIHHSLAERLAGIVSPLSARVWSVALLITPLLTGWGLAAPLLCVLALLWPYLKPRERAVPVMLAAALLAVPAAGTAFSRLGLPQRLDLAPLYGVQVFEDTVDPAGDIARIQRRLARDSSNPYMRFALGWCLRRAGDLPAAEQAYRSAVERAPRPDRTLNNLGNVLALQGRHDEAVEAYQQALKLNPSNAAAHYNLSQIYSLRFDYTRANEELAAASALDFELVRGQQLHIPEDGSLPLFDTWLDPTPLWKALVGAPPGPGGMPLPWRGLPENAGWPFTLGSFALVAACLWLGARLHTGLPARHCSNCQRVICRRCAVRAREHAHCMSCARIAAQAENPDFGRVLLLQYQRRVDRGRSILRTALAALVPGFGLLAHRRAFTPVLLLGSASLLLSGPWGVTAPFALEPDIGPWDARGLAPLMLAAWILVYLISLGGYLARAGSAEAQARALARPVSGRVRQSPTSAAAA